METENSESAVLRAIAELEALDERDDIHDTVRWQLESGWRRETGRAPGPRLDWYGIPHPDRDFWHGFDAWICEIVQSYTDALTEAITGTPPVRLHTTPPARLRRISPVTGQPYPPEADTRAMRPIWDSRMRPWADIFADVLGDTDLRIDRDPDPTDAPYREHVQLEPGDRVGWDNGDGVIHTGIVESHRPTGWLEVVGPLGTVQQPHEWTITIGEAQ